MHEGQRTSWVGRKRIPEVDPEEHTGATGKVRHTLRVQCGCELPPRPAKRLSQRYRRTCHAGASVKVACHILVCWPYLSVGVAEGGVVFCEEVIDPLLVAQDLGDLLLGRALGERQGASANRTHRL